MSRPLKAVAIVAGVVAISFAIPGFGTAIGAAVGLSISAGTAATIAAVASAVSAVASAGSAALQKPPDMRGTISQVLIGANMPVIYAMGWTLIGGALVHDSSANGPDNFDRTQFFVGSAAGPIDSFEQLLADYSPITFPILPGGGDRLEGVASGFYGADGGYLWINSRRGERPDTALTPPAGRAAFNGWGANHKTSGFASWSLTMEFDEDGVRWASGIPQWGMIAKWVRIYDPRLDDTYPGGVGDHRWPSEGAWTWSENPGLHALTYARGRFMNGVKIVGVGLPKEAIDIPAFVELANICDTNGWKVGGAVYEGPGISKWDNLKRILAAAAAEPIWVGGMLTIKMSAPRVALDTITADDLAGGVDVRAMSDWKDRKNTLVPRYRSPDHRWEYVQADAVVNSTYLTEDGEEKTDEVQYDLCQEVDHAAQLGAYTLANRREFGPIRLSVKPRLMGYKVGEALEIDIPEAGLENQLAVIVGRQVDPASGAISLTLESETTAKHAWALGQTGVAPPTPTILDPGDIDEAVDEQNLTTAQIAEFIRTSSVAGLTFSIDDAGDTTVSNHQRIYSDKPAVSVTGAVVPRPSGTFSSDGIVVFYDQADRSGGAVTYQAARVPGGAGDLDDYFASAEHPYRHFVCFGTFPASGGTTTGGSGVGPGTGGTTGPGGGGLTNID